MTVADIYQPVCGCSFSLSLIQNIICHFVNTFQSKSLPASVSVWRINVLPCICLHVQGTAEHALWILGEPGNDIFPCFPTHGTHLALLLIFLIPIPVCSLCRYLGCRLCLDSQISNLPSFFRGQTHGAFSLWIRPSDALRPVWLRFKYFIFSMNPSFFCWWWFFFCIFSFTKWRCWMSSS